MQQSLPKKWLQKVAFRWKKVIVNRDLPFGIDRCTWKVTEAERHCWKARGETIWEIPRIIRPPPLLKLFLNNFSTIPQAFTSAYRQQICSVPTPKRYFLRLIVLEKNSFALNGSRMIMHQINPKLTKLMLMLVLKMLLRRMTMMTSDSVAHYWWCSVAW